MERSEPMMHLSYPDPQQPSEMTTILTGVAVDARELAAVPDFAALVAQASPKEGKGATRETEKDNQGIRQLEALKNIGLSEQEMEMLRKKLQEGMSAAIDQVFAALAKSVQADKLDPLAPPAASKPSFSEEMDLRTLMKISRDGESMIRNGRELAEDIVVGSLVNWGNEVWDPNDPQTSQTAQNNLLLKLLQQ